MSKELVILMAVVLAVTAGCTCYQTAPGVYTTTPISKFDKSWSAAVGALVDQGIRIGTENRAAGVVQGTLNGFDVTANVQSQADGSVKVQLTQPVTPCKNPV